MKTDLPIPQLMTVIEAAKYLNVSATTVRRLVADGRITHYRIGTSGGRIRFARHDLDDFLRHTRS